MLFRALPLLIAGSLLLATPPPKAREAPPEGVTKLLVSSIINTDMAGVRIAFEQGADPNVGDKRTPMNIALIAFWASDPALEKQKKAEGQQKAMGIIKFLFSKGAKLKNDPDELFGAVICKSKPVFEYLLSKGLDPHGLYDGYNLVELSFVREADMNIPLLEKRGVPKIDPQILPVLKMMRAVHGHEEMKLARLINDEKPDVNQYDPSGRTVLVEVLDNREWLFNSSKLSAVLDAHPDWNLPSKNEHDFGRYPLHFAMSGCGIGPNYDSLTSRLVEVAIQTMGANPNVTDALRQSPLHNAAKGGALPVVKTLLQCGANPLAVDSRFRRPSQVATAPEVIRFLEEAEAVARNSH